MSVVSSRFIINFKANGINQLRTVRSEIKGIQQQSYISLNQASRNMNSFERSSVKSLNNIDRSLKRLNLSFKYGVLSLGAIGTGAFIAGVNGLARAFLHTNVQIQTSKIMIEELIGSRGKAKEFISVMQDMASTFGHDMSEVMTSSRGIMQVMRNIGQPEAKNFKEILKITMALSAMDTENRGLSYYAYSMKETMQGQGMIDFTSLARRLEVTFSKAAKTGMVKAAKEGNMNEFVKLMKNEFKRIGIDPDTLLSRMTKESFMVNINRLQSYVTMAFQKAGEKGFYALTEPLSKFAEYISKNMSEDGWIGKALGRLSYTISDKIQPFIDVLNGMGSDALLKRFEIMDGFVYSIANNLIGAKDFFGMFGAFAHGATGTGIDSYFGINGLLSGLNSFSNLGKKISFISNELTPSIYGLGQAFHYLGTSLSGLTGGGAGALGFLKGMINTISMAVTGLGGIAKGLSAPKQAGTQLGGEGSSWEKAGTVISGVMTFAMIASLMKGKGGKFGNVLGSSSSATATAEAVQSQNLAKNFGGYKSTRVLEGRLARARSSKNVLGQQFQYKDIVKANAQRDLDTLNTSQIMEKKRLVDLEKEIGREKYLYLKRVKGDYSTGKFDPYGAEIVDTRSTREAKRQIKMLNQEKKDLLKSVESRKGSISSKELEISRIQNDPSLVSKFGKAKNTEQTLMQKLSEKSGYKGIVENIREKYKTGKLANSEQVMSAISTFSIFGVAIAGLLPYLSKLTPLIGRFGVAMFGLATSMPIFGTTIAMLLSPMGLLTLGIGALITGLGYLTMSIWNNKEAQDAEAKILEEKNATENQQRLQRVLRGAGIFSGASEVKKGLDSRAMLADGTLESSQNFLNRLAPKDRKPFMNLLDAIHKGEISPQDQSRMFGDANSAWLRGLEAEYNSKTNEIKMIKVDPYSLDFLAKSIGEQIERRKLQFRENNTFSSEGMANGGNVVLGGGL